MRVKEREQTGREVKAKVNWTTNVNRSVSSAMLLGEGMTFHWHILLLRGERAAPSACCELHPTTAQPESLPMLQTHQRQNQRQHSGYEAASHVTTYIQIFCQ